MLTRENTRRNLLETYVRAVNVIPAWIFLLLQASTVGYIGVLWALLGRASANCAFSEIPFYSLVTWQGIVVAMWCLSLLLGALFGAYLTGRNKKEWAVVAMGVGYFFWAAIYLTAKIM